MLKHIQMINSNDLLDRGITKTEKEEGSAPSSAKEKGNLLHSTSQELRIRPRRIVEMGTLKTFVLIVGIVAIISIILVFILHVDQLLKAQILNAVYIGLTIVYVLATYYLVSVNEKLVARQNTPIVTAEVDCRLRLLEKQRMQLGKDLTEEEKNDEEFLNRSALFLKNTSMNNAMDVRVIITAFVNEKKYNSSPPSDGSRDWHVQAGHTVSKPFKMDDYLKPAGTTIKEMMKEVTIGNKEKQLRLNVDISYSDGFGKPIKVPTLSWYFNFMEKSWVFVI
jgi:hypothetical protein